jgi:hypothetical protein
MRAWDELVARVRRFRDMTPREREEQAIDFAYGNLAASTHHRPTRRTFEILTQRRGWTAEQFEAWAKDKEWST